MPKAFEFTFAGDDYPECGIRIKLIGGGGTPGIIDRLDSGCLYTLVLPDDLGDPIVPEALQALANHLCYAEEVELDVDELRDGIEKVLNKKRRVVVGKYE
jgi:hypothetical protein